MDSNTIYLFLSSIPKLIISQICRKNYKMSLFAFKNKLIDAKNVRVVFDLKIEMLRALIQKIIKDTYIFMHQ